MTKTITITPHDALKRQFLFENLSSQKLNELADLVKFIKFPKGHILFKKGDIALNLILLIVGRTQNLQTTEDGKVVSVNFVEAGECIGEISVVDGGVHSTTLVASTDIIIGLLDNNIAKHLFLSQPTITERVFQKLCHTIRHADQIQSVLTIHRAHARIYNLLLNTAKPQANNILAISDLPTQHDIAALANVSRETVSRALQILIREGVIKKDTKRLIVCNVKKLEEMAKLNH